ncbi:hypothetical protein N1851_004165 [Merluccius polli]|uniref:Ubiquitin-like protease family profile domain-containing protein n=1 Tax=Merluccius polli TaxID=89951 RepID=A0AA47N8B7_MERPO|nr:hypothetical protein N1851_004165 [Merluccius polli]
MKSQDHCSTLRHAEFLTLRPRELICGEVIEAYMRATLNQCDPAHRIFQLDHYTNGVILEGSRERMSRHLMRNVRPPYYVLIDAYCQFDQQNKLTVKKTQVNLDTYDAAVSFVNVDNNHWRFVYLHAPLRSVFVIDPAAAELDLPLSTAAVQCYTRFFRVAAKPFRQNGVGKHQVESRNNTTPSSAGLNKLWGICDADGQRGNPVFSGDSFIQNEDLAKGYGSSPGRDGRGATVCIRWIFRLPLCVKRFPHWLHTYGFSPVWMRMCRFSEALLDNNLPHKAQELGGSPVWPARWWISSSWLANRSPQKLQSRLLATACGNTWLCFSGNSAPKWPGCLLSLPTTPAWFRDWVAWRRWSRSAWPSLPGRPAPSCIPRAAGTLSLGPLLKLRMPSWVMLGSRDSELRASSSDALKRVSGPSTTSRPSSPCPWTLTIRSSSLRLDMWEEPGASTCRPSVVAARCMLRSPKPSQSSVERKNKKKSKPKPRVDSPFPSGLLRGLEMLARARAKRLAARDALDLVWSRRENSSLLITFILVLSASRRAADPSENSWLISETAAFASTSMMDESCSSKVEPHGDMFIGMFSRDYRNCD